MSKNNYPITAAIRFLRKQNIDFSAYIYPYLAHGGTTHSAACLQVDEHKVIKTIVLQNENKQGLVVLMHGDKQISTRALARYLQMKHIEAATPDQAQKWTGYLVGGTSPFGCKSKLPIYIESSIWDLDVIYINGGKRGFLVSISPKALRSLQPQDVQVAI